MDHSAKGPNIAFGGGGGSFGGLPGVAAEMIWFEKVFISGRGGEAVVTQIDVWVGSHAITPFGPVQEDVFWLDVAVENRCPELGFGADAIVQIGEGFGKVAEDVPNKGFGNTTVVVAISLNETVQVAAVAEFLFRNVSENLLQTMGRGRTK